MSKGADKIELFDSAFIITSLPSLTPDAYDVSTTILSELIFRRYFLSQLVVQKVPAKTSDKTIRKSSD